MFAFLAAPELLAEESLAHLDHADEIAEFYSVTEVTELRAERKAAWTGEGDAGEGLHASICAVLPDFERAEQEVRDEAGRRLHYIALGSFLECRSEKEFLTGSNEGCTALVEEGVLECALDALAAEFLQSATLPEDNDPPSLATSSSARTWAGLVYLILETARAQLAEHRAQGGEGEGPPMWAQVRSALLEFHRDGKGFLEFLLGMIHVYVESKFYHLPIKKILLLAWKAAELMYGDLEDHARLKGELRAAAGLPPCDPIDPAIALAPQAGLVEPASKKIDRFAKNKPGGLTVTEEELTDGEATETEEDPEESGEDTDTELPETPKAQEDDEEYDTFEEGSGPSPSGARQGPLARRQSSEAVPLHNGRDEKSQPSSGSLRRPAKPGVGPGGRVRVPPKPPKVSPAYLENFRLQLEARPFASMFYDEEKDEYRHPPAIDEATKTLETALYTSFRHVDCAAERKRQETQLAHGLSYVGENSTDGGSSRVPAIEELFKNIVQTWPEHSIDLVRLLFAGTSLNTSGVHKEASMSFRSELRPSDPTIAEPSTPMQVALEHQEHARHGGIITKAVAALLLLLVKFLNLNNTFQAEYVGAKLVQAKCIIVAIKALNKPDVVDHFCHSLDRSDILEVLVPPPNRPSLELADAEDGTEDALNMRPEGSSDPSQMGDREEDSSIKMTTLRKDSGTLARQQQPPSTSDDGAQASPAKNSQDKRVTNRRHVQSTISLLRLLQKVTKGKHYRVVQLVHSKSIEILKPLLRVQHGAIQLYTLKLIKSQVPYFSRSWKKNNQMIVSSIDLKVRHHILDPWFYMQVEETSDATHDDEEGLREMVTRYVQEYFPTEPDSLSEILKASSIFDLYQPSLQ